MKTYERMTLQEAERHIKRRVEERVRYGESEALLHKGEALMALMEKALRGEATEADMKPIVEKFSNKHWMRRFYTAVVSWALYSKEYISSVRRLTHELGGAAGVIEVCAGSGLLRAENWVCTDAVDGGLDALEAIEVHEDREVLFASWIPYQSELDYQLTQRWVVEQGKPFLLLGEWNGCTGSQIFWEKSDVEYRVLCNDEIREKWPWFRDVPQWDGLNDETYLVLPLREEDYDLEVPGARFVCPACGCTQEECEC